MKDIEQERKQLDAHWQQRLMRSRYEVDQAYRQDSAVDPEHRLVARELEHRWDAALRADEQLQADEWWLMDLASELGMPISTLHRWQRVGWVTSRKVPELNGRLAIYADMDE